MPHVNEVFSKPWWSHLKGKYSVSKLPVPDNYDPGEGGAPFERMSVAFGLAIPLPQIGDFVLPSGSPDHTHAPPREYTLDHEDLYPR